MEALTAIHMRQSTGKVKPEAVPRELIEKLLAAAVQAPNHYKVRPWRFVVLSGAARERLGEVMAQSLLKAKPDSRPEALDAERKKPLRAPVLIAVGVDQPDEPKVKEIENICAAAAAIENLLIAAQALGLGTFWRTGPAAEHPAVKQFLGLAPDQHIISFVYLGYPLNDPLPVERPSAADRTLWME
jgi:nitroreductase